MSCTVVTKQIQAPLTEVFQVISDITQFATAIPHILRVEFLTDQKTGVGTRFRETREMNGREVTVELEVTEWVKNDRVRIVSDEGGTIWDTVFTVKPNAEQTELTLTMDARAYKLFARLMNYFIAGMIKKQIEKDMDHVKAYCESDRVKPD